MSTKAALTSSYKKLCNKDPEFKTSELGAFIKGCIDSLPDQKDMPAEAAEDKRLRKAVWKMIACRGYQKIKHGDDYEGWIICEDEDGAICLFKYLQVIGEFGQDKPSLVEFETFATKLFEAGIIKRDARVTFNEARILVNGHQDQAFIRCQKNIGSYEESEE